MIDNRTNWSGGENSGFTILDFPNGLRKHFLANSFLPQNKVLS